MEDTITKHLNEMYRKFEGGKQAQALQELREFSQTLHDPWDKTEFLYHETLWLLELSDVKSARGKLGELKANVSALTTPPEDSYEIVLPLSLTVMTGYAELKVLLAEKNESEALNLVEWLLSRYPKQLSTPDFKVLFDEIKTHQGFLLANAERWTEARPILETAVFPREWRNVICYYLGYCYYEFREYERARSKLMEALSLGLIDSWARKAHYLAGIVEYHLGDIIAAKMQFELCVKTASSEYLATTKIREWLEVTSRVLGEYDEAEKYRKRRGNPTDSTVN
jgi:tetratricopeptide (TPR) repeat protein